MKLLELLAIPIGLAIVKRLAKSVEDKTTPEPFNTTKEPFKTITEPFKTTTEN